MMMAKMTWFSMLIFHFILVDIALAMSLAGNKSETKEPQTAGPVTAKTTLKTTLPTSTTTTLQPSKGAVQEEKHENPDIRLKQRESLEKPLPKKRGVLDELYRVQPGSFDDNYDANDETLPEESFSGPRSDFEERPLTRYNDFAFLNNDGYFENEGRSKKAAEFDGVYGRPQEPEIELTPEEVMALLSLLEERRNFNAPKQNYWPDHDNTVDSIEADMRDEDVYRDRPGNLYDGMYENNFERYPTGMKRYMITKRRRNDLLGNPKLKIPIFRRAIL